jgi:hypothetical protein
MNVVQRRNGDPVSYDEFVQVSSADMQQASAHFMQQPVFGQSSVPTGPVAPDWVLKIFGADSAEPGASYWPFNTP